MSDTPAKLDNPPVSSSSGHGKAWLGFCLVTVLAVGGGLHWFHNGQMTALQQQLTQAQQQTLSVDTALQQVKQTLSQTRSEQMALASSQSHFEQALAKITDYTQADWLIAESAYLTNLAIARLETSQDLPVALKQLVWAQARLNKLSDPSLLSLKERLAKDINKLEGLNALDWEQVWVSLGTLSDTLETLPFQVSLSEEVAAKEAVEQERNWEVRLAQSWEQIRSLIRVRRQTDSATLPLVTGSEKQHYLFAMQFLIEEARWAVINRNQPVYQGALKLLQHRLNAQFDMTSSQVQAFSERLDSLMAVELALSLPDLSELVRLFDQVQSKRTGGV